MNKLKSTNELTINLPNGLGEITPHCVVIPTSEAHQRDLLETGWFTAGNEISEAVVTAPPAGDPPAPDGMPEKSKPSNRR